MTDGAGGDRSLEVTRRDRLALLCAGIVVLVAALAPPLGPLSRRYVFVGAVQFGLCATVVPALVTLSAPWGLRRHVAPKVLDARRSLAGSGRVAGVAAQRLRHRGPLWSVGYVVLYAAATIGWRVPASVDALARHPALSLLEAGTLLLVGVLLWLELVVSPPFVPRSSYPVRIALAAIAMWVTWIMAYLLGMSHSAWFPAYRHVRGAGLSLIADQQMAAGLLWLLAAIGYIPLIFASLVVWLKDSEDPDDELRRIVRAERRRSWASPKPVRRRRRGAPPGA